MSYKRRPPKHPEIISFLRHYVVCVPLRDGPDRPSPQRPQEIIDSLHDLRLRYDRLGIRFKRVHTKRRYYKRVRDDAPYASRLPIKINGRVDWLRRIVKPAAVIDLAAYRLDRARMEAAVSKRDQQGA